MTTPARIALLVSAAIGAAAFGAARAQADDVKLTETGSTLLGPLFDIWVEAYAAGHPSVRITTGATGSEAGLTQALSGQVTIGASDAFLSDSQARAHPDFLCIPLAISALSITYNLPGLEGAHLRLDGAALAGIYGGTLKTWDAPQIMRLNPGVALPHQPIIAVRRSDGSGDTFVFSQFLSFSTPSWNDGPGFGTSIAWPAAAGERDGTGNAGMLTILQATPYSIGYLGISFSDAAAQLGTAALGNEDGRFVLPTPQTILAGAISLGVRTPPDERLTLVFAPGAQSYPLVNYEYVVVAAHQADPAVAAALRRFLLWTIEPSEDRAAMLDRVHFVPLPPHIWELSQAQIQMIR